MPYAATIFLSSFLLFLVQPIIAKQILPWFGGSAGVWTTCLVFFQSVLLAGYAYADWTMRLGARRQAIVHVGLLALSLAFLPILASSAWKPSSVRPSRSSSVECGSDGFGSPMMRRRQVSSRGPAASVVPRRSYSLYPVPGRAR